MEWNSMPEMESELDARMKGNAMLRTRRGLDAQRNNWGLNA
jgi:hypothetical protein